MNTFNGFTLCQFHTIFLIGVHTFWNNYVLCDLANSSNQVVVEFDPYVSILDKANRSRYNVKDLQVLIAKVATKFSIIYIEFTDADVGYQGNSLVHSPQAAAVYNSLSNNSQKVEVWLGLYRKSNNQINDQTLARIFSNIKETNKICNGTVTNFLMPQRRSPKEDIYIRDRSSWFQSTNTIGNRPTKHNTFVGLGILITYPYSCDEEFVDYFSPNLLVFRKPSVTENVSENTTLNILTKCQQKLQNRTKSLKFGIMNGYPDTISDKPLSRSYLVSSWKNAIKWSNESKNFVVLSRAFDTPYKHSVEEQTMGFWRVVDNCTDYNQTFRTRTTFVDKDIMTGSMDWQENPRSYDWLRNKAMFYENTTGLIFFENEFQNLVETSNIISFLITHKNLRILVEKNPWKPGQMVSGKFNYQPINQNISLPDMMDNIIKFEPYINDFYNQVTRKIPQQSEVHSNSFDADLCESYTTLTPYMKVNLFQLLRNNDKKMFLFYFKEDPTTIKLGARRMSEQRLVLLSQCRRMLYESGNRKTEIGFALLEYPKPTHFFESAWTLQNFVRYWQILTEWAASQHNVVVFLPAVDQEKFSELLNIGWWTPKPFENAFSNYTTTLIDKQVMALKLSELQYDKRKPRQNIAVTPKYYLDRVYLNKYIRENVSYNSTIHKMSGLNGTHIALLIVGLLTFSALTILCSTSLIRAYYKNRALSKNEIDDFFNGNNSSENSEQELFNKAPYDKSRYEIGDSKYSFDDDNVLGAGEFGKVLRGKVETPDGSMNVAVKTTNPQTNHVTTLKGLLSEVKLLAYIGKHANIIELIGANTGHLKCGKIWIFLELCELGSLQKYLRKIREPSSFSLVKYSSDNSEVTMSNANEQPKRENLEDVTLKNDLYRWSTEICCGMEYLAKKHVVHADLATRNVLLSSNKEAKICDFGLSRRMYNYTDYVKTNQEPLPWKWMAPESLKFMHFNEKSDVWAFGITLWELYSLGETPYQGLSWDNNFSNLLDSGLRPLEPAFNERDMYQLMLNCWNGDPEQRPSFAELYTLLTAND